MQSKTDTLDAHGGWYDVTGDYGKHLSQTGKDADWLRTEQWLPHAAWYMLGVASR